MAGCAQRSQEHVGKDRAQYLYDRLAEHALTVGIESSRPRVTPYINTIPVGQQPPYPGNLEIEEKLAAALRGTRLPWSCEPTRRMANLAAILRAMRPRRISSKWVSTIFSARRRRSR